MLLPCLVNATETVHELAHPFHLLKSGKKLLRLKSGYFLEEHEYEKGEVLQDLFEYNHWAYNIESIFGLPGDRQLGLTAVFESHGKLHKDYSASLNIPPQSLNYDGFHALEIFFQEHLQTLNEKNKLALEIRVKGSPIKGKETNSSYAGYDLALSFLYSHKHDEWLLYGDLHTEIIGGKKIKKYDGEVETINAYSQFGNLLGLQWYHENFWLDGNALFYLTTDYNSTSASYTRLTDKGFVIGGKILLGLRLSPYSYLTLEHIRQSSTFNVITESTTQGNEFEVETQNSQVGVTWLF